MTIQHLITPGNKRGFFFTIITIAIISLFFISYEVYDWSRPSSIQQRINTMDSFLSSVDENLNRQIYTIGFRTIFEIESHIASTGNYTSELNYRFEEAFFNGTLYNVSKSIFLGATYSDILEDIQEQAAKINTNITLTNPKISIYQTDPWNVIVNATFNLTLEDKNHLARWNRIEEVIVPISIDGFEDPLYVKNTAGLVTNKINHTLFELAFVSGTNVTNLSIHLLNSNYANSTTAPSFLMRLQGINSPSEYGIESMVNLQRLSSQGIAVKNKTVIDYIYFSASSPSASHVSGMPSWFVIDNNHVDRYQCTGLTY